MTNDETKPVVVGIDGSNAAIDAAQWAISEALARDVPLRLIFAANTPRTQGDPAIRGPAAEYGQASLRAAAAAMVAMGEPVKVETDLLWGPPSNALIAESRRAAMVCVGTVGIGIMARAILGSTATGVATWAHCPVAVIRPRAGTHSVAENWVAVGIDDRPSYDVAVTMALREARIRNAPLVAVGLGCNTFGVNTVEKTERRLERWRQQYPDVRIDVFSTRGGVAEFLADNRDDLSRRYPATTRTLGDPGVLPLAVLGASDVSELMTIIGPQDHALCGHAECSVLIAH